NPPEGGHDARRDLLYVSESQYCSIRRRIAASGSRPRPAPWLSSRFLTCVVPGIVTVTAGCETMYFRNTCAQLDASNSAAQSGSSLPFTFANVEAAPRPRPPNGTL